VLAALEAGMTREQIREHVIGQAAELADELLDDTLETRSSRTPAMKLTPSSSSSASIRRANSGDVFGRLGGGYEVTGLSNAA
jgi:hypothetical protein